MQATGPDEWPPSPLPDEIVPDEVSVIALLAAVETFAAGFYTAAAEASSAGTFGAVPDALTRFMATALDHHSGTLPAWVDALAGTGQPAITAPPELVDDFGGRLGVATDAVALSAVLLDLERLVAATYLDALGALVSRPAVFLAASVLPVYQRFVSTLLFLRGEYPVPDAFATAEAAYRPSSS